MDPIVLLDGMTRMRQLQRANGVNIEDLKLIFW